MAHRKKFTITTVGKPPMNLVAQVVGPMLARLVIEHGPEPEPEPVEPAPLVQVADIVLAGPTRLRAVVAHVYGAGWVELAYLQGDGTAAREEANWKNGAWEFKTDQPCGYVLGKSEAAWLKNRLRHS